MAEHHHHAHQQDADSPLRIGRKLAITLTAFILILCLSFLEPLAPLNESLVSYLRMIWWAVLLGLLLGGLIDYFVPDGFLIRFLGPKQKFSVPYAVVAGFAMSACSHGILAIAMQLYKKGAGVPAVVTFLLASPWANLPVTILLIGFFGWSALYFIGGAILIAFITGTIFTGLDRIGWIEGQSPAIDSNREDWGHLRDFKLAAASRGVLAGSISLANMVLWWVIIGVLIAATISAYVPEHIFMNYLGPDPAGVGVTLLLATVIEVCSEGTSPMAFEIFNQVGALGNPFVFLMAGVATDYTEIGLIWNNIGKRAAIWLPLVAVPQIFFFGLVLNWLA